MSDEVAETTADTVFPPLSANPKPETPRPPMTLNEQANLLEYLHGRCTMSGERAILYVEVSLDRNELDDLWLTAQRLRRMAPHEAEIRRLVTRK
jgi:hypothetical protein